MPETETFKPEPAPDAVHDKTPRNCEVCGKECIGAGGLGAHMTSHYRKGEAEPPTNGSGTKIRCPQCKAVIGKAYLQAHIIRKHSGTSNGYLEKKAGHLGRPIKRVQTENLGAREVCRVVLEQALHDSKINLDALDAYEQWVQDTEKFLTVLYR